MREKRKLNSDSKPQTEHRVAAASPAAPSSHTTQPSQKKAGPKKRKWYVAFLLGLLKVLFVCLCLGVMAASVMAVSVSSYLATATANDDTLLDLDNLKLSYSSAIYVKDTATGEYYEYQKLIGDENREWVDLDNIPKMVQNAFVAAEDQTFWTHQGFSIKRTGFAALSEIAYKLTGHYLGTGIKQGASTIDQQLVKNLLDDDAVVGKEGYMRKVREIFRAYVLEKRYTKDMILEAYLNVISLTGNTAGVEAGARAYFGKDVADLNLQEAASLACITNNPTNYNPWTNPDAHLERRDYVLKCMLDQGYISQSEYDTAVASPLELAQSTGDTTQQQAETGNVVQQVTDPDTGETVDKVVPYTSKFSWFTDKVIDDVINDLMTQKGMTKEEASYYLYNGGLKIYATMVPEVQNAMEDVMANATMFPVIEATTEDGETVTPQSGMACVNYQGELVGVVGSIGTKTKDRAFDRATDAVRPVGSSMKPIGVYGLGVEYDYITYSSAIEDSPIQKKAIEVDPNAPDPNAMVDWPRNYSGSYTRAPMTVAYALAHSINTVAIKVDQMVTPESSYEFLTNTLQVSSLEYPQDVSIAPMSLGSVTQGISPYQMAGAYMIFGNGGRYTTLHSYTTVEDRSGDVVCEPQVTTVQALGEDTAMIMNKLLYGVLHGGTGNGLYVRDDMESIGKTGTTSDDKDHWFVGLTPYYCTATWWGYDDQITLDWRAYSQHPPTLAWRAVMEEAQANLEYKAFPSSDKVTQITYCLDSGCVAGPNCPNTAVGYYKVDGRQPDPVCTAHTAP